MFLSCSMVREDEQSFQYSFVFNPEEEYLFWVEGSNEWEIIRNTSAQFWASRDTRIRGLKAREIFKLNRITGAARINYSREPTPEELENYNYAFWCTAGYIVLTEYTEVDSCMIVNRVIE